MNDSKNKSHYRDCKRKVRYNDMNEAERYAKWYGLRAYYCEHCNGYHLTSREYIVDEEDGY